MTDWNERPPLEEDDDFDDEEIYAIFDDDDEIEDDFDDEPEMVDLTVPAGSVRVMFHNGRPMTVEVAHDETVGTLRKRLVSMGREDAEAMQVIMNGSYAEEMDHVAPGQVLVFSGTVKGA